MGTALCIESGMWRSKQLDDIDYECTIDLEHLFPERTSQGFKVKTEAQEADDQLLASTHHDEDEDFNPETDGNTIAPMVDDPEGDPDFKSTKKPRKTKVGKTR